MFSAMLGMRCMFAANLIKLGRVEKWRSRFLMKAVKFSYFRVSMSLTSQTNLVGIK